jgi:hypothetical protein
MASGEIPEPQARRLQAFGAWLRANGSAIYGTRPRAQAEATTSEGLPVRFTRGADGVNLIVLGSPKGERLRIKDVSLSGQGRLLADGSPVTVAQEGPDAVLTFVKPLDGSFAPAVTFGV